MMFYLGNKVEGVIPDKERKAKNNMKLWDYGYHPEIDAVVISKNGTLGEIYDVQGLRIGFPEQPEPEKILNYGKREKDQKWTREELPDELTDIEISKATADIKDPEAIQNYIYDLYEKYEDFIGRHYEIRNEGLWVYIKGHPIFIVGTYAFGIQWIREEEDYPDFRQIQNELMIFWEACKADTRSMGMQYVKNRRMGASLMAIFELTESGSVNENKLLGIVSKKGSDSSKIFRRLVIGFKRLPSFFRPVTDGTTTPKKQLIFDEPTRRRKRGESLSAGDGLQTMIEWHNTDMNAMDGDPIFRSLLDESGKYPTEVPFSKYWSIVKTSHTKGIRITGKAMVVSTVNSRKKGGGEYKIVWDDSGMDKRDGNGRTKSGLYRIFIAAEYCLEGKFDQYGFSIVEDPLKPVLTDQGEYTRQGAISWLANEEAKFKNDPEKLNEFKRQFPRNIKDAFRDESDDCEFNQIHLEEQLDYNENELNDVYIDGRTWTGNDAVIRIKLFWRDGREFTAVDYKEDPKGPFYVRKDGLPPDDLMNNYSQRMINGVIANAPAGIGIGCIGIDPYNRSKTADGKGSDGSIIGGTGTHTHPGLPCEKTLFEYIHRPKRIELFFHDALMASIFWGFPFLAELSNEAFLTLVKKNGFRHFSMNNPFKRFSKLNPTEKELGGAPHQGDTVADAQFYATEAYIQDHIGVARDSRHRIQGQMGDFPFSRTLYQFKDVDLKNRTAYDAYIAWSLHRVGIKRPSLKVEMEEAPVNFSFQKYDNSGQVSRAIR